MKNTSFEVQYLVLIKEVKKRTTKYIKECSQHFSCPTVEKEKDKKRSKKSNLVTVYNRLMQPTGVVA